MKTNKLAAGALALALGLGAVTPAFAESTKTGNEKKGEVIITQEYRDAETAFVKAFKAVKDAEAKEAEAKKVRDAKEAAHEEAKAAIEKHDEETKAINDRLASVDEEGNRIYEQLKGNGGSSSATGWKDVTRDNFTLGDGDDASKNAQQASLEDLLAKQAKYKEVEKELEGRDETRRKLEIAVDRAAEELDVAETNYQNAVIATAAAKLDYKPAKDAFVEAGAERAKIGRAEKYGDLKYITVDPADKDSESDKDSDSKEDVLAKAEKAYDDARVTVKAVELIKVTAPKVYENNKVAIDTYLEKANTALDKLGKALGKKVAISDVLFSTAYAAEEASLEEIEDLTKEVEEVDKEGKELLENINKQEEEADKEDENKDKPADDKKDNEEKPADDEKDEKEDDKKADDKKDEKKPAAKKASSNAKTGVAGVTGVAGILAAASVAYAASKKRD